MPVIKLSKKKQRLELFDILIFQLCNIAYSDISPFHYFILYGLCIDLLGGNEQFTEFHYWHLVFVLFPLLHYTKTTSRVVTAMKFLLLGVLLVSNALQFQQFIG